MSVIQIRLFFFSFSFSFFYFVIYIFSYFAKTRSLNAVKFASLKWPITTLFNIVIRFVVKKLYNSHA